MPDRTASRALALAATGLLLSGCGLFGDDEEGDSTSVFDVEPGACIKAVDEVKAQVSDLVEVPCTEPHAQEAYAVVAYQPVEGEADDDAFPGEEALSRFADGACAQEFAGYVGVDYLDSSLFFTYLLPSPRSWEEDDRDVLCLVTTAGEPLTESVEGTQR